MKRNLAAIFAAAAMLMLCPLTRPVSANDTGPVTVSSPATPAGAQDAVLVPVVSFRADAAGDDLFEALRAAHAFAHLSKEAPGSPIQLRVYHSVHPANIDAKNFFSGLLAVGTLGLSPVVMSGEHTLHYDLYVNGQRISRHEYSAKLSRNEHLNGRAPDPTHGLGPDGVIWAKSTVDLFLSDLAQDRAVRALNDEYQVYFGAPNPPSGAADPTGH